MHIDSAQWATIPFSQHQYLFQANQEKMSALSDKGESSLPQGNSSQQEQFFSSTNERVPSLDLAFSPVETVQVNHNKTVVSPLCSPQSTDNALDNISIIAEDEGFELHSTGTTDSIPEPNRNQVIPLKQ